MLSLIVVETLADRLQDLFSTGIVGRNESFNLLQVMLCLSALIHNSHLPSNSVKIL